MRIWLLTSEYPPFFGGGIATYCQHTARMFAQRGHQVTVFVNDDSLGAPVRTAEESNGLRVVRFKPGGTAAYRYLGWYAALSHQFSEVVEEFIEREGPPDVIETQEYLGIGYFLLQKKHTLFPRLRSVPIVVTAHAPMFICDEIDQAPAYRFPRYWIGEMERYSIRAADALVSPSHFLARELAQRLRLHLPDVQVILNPYQPEEGWHAPPPAAFERNDVLFIGRTQHLKGVGRLLEYLTPVWDAGGEVPLRIVGGDAYFHPKGCNYREYLNRKYRVYVERGLIQYEGDLAPAALRARASRAHLIIAPSLFENLPYVVLESMAQGKVVLASRSGGHRELIGESGEHGFLFSHGQPDEFRAQFARLLQMSDAEILSVGQSARDRARRYCDSQVVYARKLELFAELRRGTRDRSVFPFIRPRQKTLTATPDTSSVERPGLLSIVVPHYNLGRYLRETIDSLAKVEYPNQEIIVVDDGSDDPASIAAIDDACARMQVKLVRKPNGGLPECRNTGAAVAQGEFLAFLDADDIVSPNYYEWAIRILQKYTNVSFVGCWVQNFGKSQGIWPTWNTEPPYLLVHNTINSSGIVFRRQDFLRHGMNDRNFAYGYEDYEAVVRMVKHGCGGVSIPLPLFQYRVRPDSMLRQIGPDADQHLCRLLAEKHQDFYREYAVDVFGLMNANGLNYHYDNPSLEPSIRVPSAAEVAGMITRRAARTSLGRSARSLAGRLRQALVTRRAG